MRSWLFLSATFVSFYPANGFEDLVASYIANSDRIFVSIVSFMDPQLEPTIENMLARAKWPDQLDFAIILQEDLDKRSDFKWETDPRFNLQRVNYLDSRGVGWARHQVISLYENQKYVLQLDSHHRFANDWDELLLEDLGHCLKKSEKPMLSVYVIPFSPDNPNYERDSMPRKLVSERYYDTGKVRFAAAVESDVGDNTPHPSAIVSAHFVFTYGSWLLDIPYDPNIYFDGEEDTLSARSWTNGWDIYYPRRAILWHQYGRMNQKKHWDLHPEWWKIKAASEERVRQILRQEPTDIDFGEFGLGSVRSYEDFQKFSGLYFPLWHLGFRARSGDVTAVEKNPPPQNSNSKRRCLFRSAQGSFVQVSDELWEERR